MQKANIGIYEIKSKHFSDFLWINDLKSADAFRHTATDIWAVGGSRERRWNI